MTRLLFTISTLIILSVSCFGQDTIKIEPSIFYSSNDYPTRGKEFASKAKYSREDIVFSANKKRIEYCYYYDSLRFCYGQTYEITSDSILKIDDQIWIYKKQLDKYFLHRIFNGTYETGYAKTLIPLERVGQFVTTTVDKLDTLWTIGFDGNQKCIFHKSRVIGKIFDSDQIDEIPTFLNGDSISEIKLEREDMCLSEPNLYVKSMSFIITNTGRIVNIEQNAGNFSLDWCTDYIMYLIRHISQYSPVRPAKVNGVNVNVKWIIKVDMGVK